MRTWQNYCATLDRALATVPEAAVERLIGALVAIWRREGQVLICGNGGSAANAQHLANDLIYGINPHGRALRAHALPANQAIVTCLANDTGYDNVFARQIEILCNPGDLVIVMSGSGNSPNILAAIAARKRDAQVAGILGYDGGRALPEVDIALHIAVADMQISEDFQSIVGHYVMQRLHAALQELGTN